MPSSVIIAAVAYGASAVVGGGLLGVVAGAAVAATLGTAINGGSWGEAFGKGLVGGAIGQGLSAIGTAASAAGEVGGGLGGSVGEAGSSLGSGLGETAGSGLGGAVAPGLESTLGSGLYGLEGAITPPDMSTLGSGLSGLGDFSGVVGSSGSDFGAGLAGAMGDGAGGPSLSDMATGAFDSGAGNSITAQAGTPTGEALGGGGMEGFQNISPTGYQGGTPGGQLGSGLYNSDPNAAMGFNGSQMTGGYSDLGQMPLPNAGNEVVPQWQGDLQKVSNGLSDFWDKNGAQLGWKTGLKAVGGLYDMYSRNKAAEGYQNTLNTLNNMYAPGSAEYNLLQQKLDRQNAAQGRRSQGVTNAGNFASQVMAQRNAILTSPQYLNTMNARNQNKFNGLGSMFNFAGGLF